MVTLSPDQQLAADKFMEFLMDDNQGELVIQGHAGTGKSFLTSYLLELIVSSADLLKLLTSDSSDVNVVLTATTNKAAGVLTKMAGMKACTIHSLLKLKVTRNFNTGKTGLTQVKDFQPIHNTLIIVDEASMVNSQLLKIIRESTKDCKVLYIMDSYQLAPIKESSCPVAEQVSNKCILSTIQRQAAGNPIIGMAEGYRKVLDGMPFPPIHTQGTEIQRVDGTTFQQLIDTQFTDPNHDVHDAKVLAWTNDRVHQYNKHIRGLYAPSDKFQQGEWVVANSPILDYRGRVIITTDSVVRISDISDDTIWHMDVECWEVDINGLGVYLPISQELVKARISTASRVAKKNKDWSDYFRIKEAFADLRPVHASTVHKSQGSTYEVAYVDLSDIGRNSRREEIARLMYVAITRAAQKVILYGKLGSKYGD